MPASRETAGQLLGADDPPPVRVLRPEGRSDFLLTADHAGRVIPRRLGTLGLPDSELARHIAWDIGIADVTERLAEALGATAVLQSYSRLVIDCNRQPVSTAHPGDQRADRHSREWGFGASRASAAAGDLSAVSRAHRSAAGQAR
jgi:N-formylglutamate amidohydrolase